MMRTDRGRQRLQLGAFVALLVIVAIARDYVGTAGGGEGDAFIAELYQAHRSDQMVTVEGVVDRTLADDNDGSRHQRFIVRLGSGHTLLIAHNIDLAERVPLAPGDRLRIRGEYEWNEQGGVLHWTHHDPGGDRVGGWIEHDGRTYR